MRKMAIAILTPIISGIILGIAGMYIDIKELKAVEPVRMKQLDRIEKRLYDIQDLLIKRNDAKIDIKRGSNDSRP